MGTVVFPTYLHIRSSPQEKRPLQSCRSLHIHGDIELGAEQGVDCSKQKCVAQIHLQERTCCTVARKETSNLQFLLSLPQQQRATLLEVEPFPRVVTDWGQLNAAAKVTLAHVGRKHTKQLNRDLWEIINNYYLKTLHFGVICYSAVDNRNWYLEWGITITKKLNVVLALALGGRSWDWKSEKKTLRGGWILARKDVHILILKTYEYVALHGKKK